MAVLHVQTLINAARDARADPALAVKGTTITQKDIFCAKVIGIVRAYDYHYADELATALGMIHLTEKELRKPEKQA